MRQAVASGPIRLPITAYPDRGASTPINGVPRNGYFGLSGGIREPIVLPSDKTIENIPITNAAGIKAVMVAVRNDLTRIRREENTPIIVLGKSITALDIAVNKRVKPGSPGGVVGAYAIGTPEPIEDDGTKPILRGGGGGRRKYRETVSPYYPPDISPDLSGPPPVVGHGNLRRWPKPGAETLPILPVMLGPGDTEVIPRRGNGRRGFTPGQGKIRPWVQDTDFPLSQEHVSHYNIDGRNAGANGAVYNALRDTKLGNTEVSPTMFLLLAAAIAFLVIKR